MANPPLNRQPHHSSSRVSSQEAAFATHKRTSSTALSPTAVLLDQLTLRVSSLRLSKRDVRYELHVEHASSKLRWRMSRSFDEYKAFQRQLLAALRLGHFCQGECPWLYSFLKSYFPKSLSFLGFGCQNDCAVEKRRVGLEHVLTSLQNFVVNPENAAMCSIVAISVTQLVANFVFRDSSAKHHLLHDLRVSGSNNSNLNKPRDSAYSPVSVTSDEGDEMPDETEDAAALCMLCSSSLRCDASGAQVCSKDFPNSSLKHRSNAFSYTTQLACGHQFHDECIVPKLNEELRCPMCRVKVNAF
ncbi:hypothetical protein CCR75_006727 [Bremia lactucae]|uniref:RING-type domain-containing protein n=1 Tax=Bremia lactucae TaxID=4779 RepID=A0A976IKN8_BRELC|nr:hypothetical protein CCR75_006727 [Bremia lactucae]